MHLLPSVHLPFLKNLQYERSFLPFGKGGIGMSHSCQPCINVHQGPRSHSF